MRAALAEGPAHAYLFHGPPGVGKGATALALRAPSSMIPSGLADGSSRPPPMLEPLGDQIRIDAVRELHHDLHMRPFEASRRVYLIIGADLLNEDAADALLKDLEEPPAYAVLVLVASHLARLPDTIRSRCQPIAFHRLSRRAIEEKLVESRPELDAETLSSVSRVAGGRLDRAERLLDPDAAARRVELVELARSVYLAERFDAGAAGRIIVDAARAAERGGRTDRCRDVRGNRSRTGSSARAGSRVVPSARRFSGRSISWRAGTAMFSPHRSARAGSP